MKKICLAVDIGASSGRLIMGSLLNKKIVIEEIYRFKNQMYKENDHYYWDIDHLFFEILTGLRKISTVGLKVESIGIDTWGVDYVLIDQEGKRLCPVYAYRDGRTHHAMADIFALCSQEKIYEKTGIQFLQFNTLYQLYVHMKAEPLLKKQIYQLLMIPDYLNYLLCDKKTMEYSNATTTQMYNIHQQSWDKALLKVAQISKDKLPKLVQPGTVIGSVSEKVGKALGMTGLPVIAPATHDTGSAVVAVPVMDNEDVVYISSGTWSLMGIEHDSPICTKEALMYNFTNEGGAYGTIRLLKNIMGLWLIQKVKAMLDKDYSFAALAQLASTSTCTSLINPNHARFLNPNHMLEEINDYCKETHQDIPYTPGDYARCVFESLALGYKQVLHQLESITGKKFHKIHIIGGGSQNTYLNQLCADYTGCVVYAGPVEATAIGNLMVQYITLGLVDSLQDARRIINHSFRIQSFYPQSLNNKHKRWHTFNQLP
ncbi:rhamnulokinase [Vallitalea pronyensis]|uniref:Rhamnulokinase n=1 Tax=Vallitalea pronyensis TaxID=1348613 RepID=A0A8J8MGS3_9FIRM|nr:rhamnulokinase [Vallitalea pronyensis]QUI20948.1 rhamnulokinase [Vallitalea pronyensis]